MRSTLLSAVSLVCFIGSAQAHEQPKPAPTPTPHPTYSGPVQGQAQAQGQLQAQGQGQRQGQVARGGAGGQGGGGYGAGGNTGPVNVNNAGGNYSARGNTPDVILGSVSGGNPCGLGAGGGGSGPGAGGLLSFMWEGAACQRLEDAKLLHNMGYDEAARERLCEDTRFSTAFANAGQPCSQDVARWQRAGYRQRPDGYWTK